MLLESDLQSLRIALADHLAAKKRVHRLTRTSSAWFERRDERQRAWDRMFHHAKVFVVSMRRFARLLEATKSRKHEYPHHLGEAIELSWKKARAFFEEYTEPRNAIEHIDGEIAGHNHHFLNLYGDYLEVVQGKRALVSRGALETVERTWRSIIAAASAGADLSGSGLLRK